MAVVVFSAEICGTVWRNCASVWGLGTSFSSLGGFVYTQIHKGLWLRVRWLWLGVGWLSEVSMAVAEGMVPVAGGLVAVAAGLVAAAGGNGGCGWGLGGCVWGYGGYPRFLWLWLCLVISY